jgi:hypothetical protein
MRRPLLVSIFSSLNAENVTIARRFVRHESVSAVTDASLSEQIAVAHHRARLV